MPNRLAGISTIALRAMQAERQSKINALSVELRDIERELEQRVCSRILRPQTVKLRLVTRQAEPSATWTSRALDQDKAG